MRTKIASTTWHDAGALSAAGGQCFVCEKTIPGGNCYAQVKHGDWTVQLCRPECAQAFYARRLPSLRSIMILAAAHSVQWAAFRAGG